MYRVPQQQKLLNVEAPCIFVVKVLCVSRPNHKLCVFVVALRVDHLVKCRPAID